MARRPRLGPWPLGRIPSSSHPLILRSSLLPPALLPSYHPLSYQPTSLPAYQPSHLPVFPSIFPPQVVDFPLPDKDVEAALAGFARQYKESLRIELQGRTTVKSAYMRGGRCDYSRKSHGLAILKQGKQAQARARGAKDKLRNIVASLQASLLRNQEVAEVKGAGRAAKEELKLAEQAAKAKAKAQAKADAKREAQKGKVWQKRHALLATWRKEVAAAAKPPTIFDIGWFGEWLKGWGKPYLNPKALHALWRAIPSAQKEHFERLRDQSRDAFAAEEGLDAQVEMPLRTHAPRATRHVPRATSHMPHATCHIPLARRWRLCSRKRGCTTQRRRSTPRRRTTESTSRRATRPRSRPSQLTRGCR